MEPLVSRRTARTTGLLYLAMALAGMPAFLVIRPMLYDPDSPAATLANLVGNETLARTGIALELALVIFQALTALWFFRLFRRVDAVTAGTLAVFGMTNAIAILGSAAALGTALDAALTGDEAGVQLMYLLSGNLWGVGAVFFGLWLIPMGQLALRAGMPRLLGWLLIAGGVGYVASALLGYLAPQTGAVDAILVAPATIAEFWTIGLLLWIGLRRERSPEVVGSASAVS